MPTRRSHPLRHPRSLPRVPASPARRKAFIQMPASSAPLRCRCPLASQKMRSSWVTAFSTARRRMALAQAAMAQMRRDRRRARLSSKAIGSSATAASNRSRTSLPMAYQSRGIILTQCRPGVARRYLIPTSAPFPLMFGRSAIRRASEEGCAAVEKNPADGMCLCRPGLLSRHGDATRIRTRPFRS